MKQSKKRARKIKALKRALLVATLVTLVGGSVTFAVLQSQQNTLTGNTIETATANLQLSTDGTNYSDTQAGFDFANIILGGPAQPVTGYPFYLKNSGGAPLSLKLAVTSAPSNPDNVDLTKVSVILTTVGTGTGTQTFSLQSLMTDGGVVVTGTPLAVGTSQQYKLQVALAADAVSGSSASLGNIDFAITGLAQ